MGVIQDLIDKTIDNSEPVANLLRRAKILAYKLKSDDLASWVEKELNGYKNKDEVPEYRIFTH